MLSSDPDTRLIVTVAVVCGSEILGLAGYSIVPALLPQFIDAWSLSNTQGGWLAGMVFAGYMVAVVPLVSLTDRVSARMIYLGASCLNVVSCFGMVFSERIGFALGFRGLAGVALAGMYMPGLRALTDAIECTQRARVSAFYTSSFTVGAVFSFLLGNTGISWGWRFPFFIAGLLAIVATLLAWMVMPRPATVLSYVNRPIFDFGSVLRNRDSVILVFAYAAAIWGSAGLRQWIVVFLAACAGAANLGLAADWTMPAMGAFINALGIPAALLGNELSLHFGLRKTALLVFLLSALATGLFGITAVLPYTVVIWIAFLAGFIVQGNFANLTSGVLAVATQGNAGATMALYSSIGFGGGFLGTVLFGTILDQFGGTSRPMAWMVSFGSCGLVCLLGAGATAFLSRELDRKNP